jgi:hypothetical protein
MGRFQLLIFIFVFSMSFFLVVVSNIKIVQANPGEHGLPGLPEVPNGVLGLRGISASSYAVGKAISGLEDAEQVESVVVLHAGTRLNSLGEVETAGGRVR